MSTYSYADLDSMLQLDQRVKMFFKALRYADRIHDELAVVLSGLRADEQRVLAQIFCWRISGASHLPTNKGLSVLPLLIGMPIEGIQAAADRLYAADIIEADELQTDDDGEAKLHGLRWPALDHLLLEMSKKKETPRLLGADGKPLSK